MKYKFRSEVLNAKKAAMGVMFNLAKENLGPNDHLINFASGHPSTDVFQDDFIKRYVNKALTQGGKDVLQYGPYAGLPSLRNTLKDFVNKRGNTIKNNDELIVTYGSIEAFSLTASALISRGEKVVVEVPSYVNAIKCFQVLGAEVIGIGLEDDGVNTDELEEAFKQGAKIFYTVPNFSNPSGVTMSEQKRREVAGLAKKYGAIVIEDNVYGDLRYRGMRIPNIKEFDDSGYVVYVGSLSKIIAPAMRIGFMVADKEFIDRVIPIKGVRSNGVNAILQEAAYLMFSENDIYSEIDKIIDVYSKKMMTMLDCMDKYFPSEVKHSNPDGGMYIWVTMPEGADVEKLCRESAIHLHIPLTPGNGFCVKEPEKCTSIRINFAKESLTDIEYGIQKVGELMREYV